MVNQLMTSNGIALVALDLDGTLLRSDGSISDATVQAVKQTIRRGVRVVLASARPPRAVRQIYETLGLEGPQINYNGALIHDATQRQHTHHQPITAGLGAELVGLARRVDPDVAVSIELLDKWYTDFVDHSLPIETSKSFEPDYLGPLDDVLQQAITKLMFLAPSDRLTAVHQAVAQNFAGRITIAISDPHLIQVLDHGVDKSNALQMIASAQGIAPQQVMAIGDAPNDVGMLRWAGVGVAVANAWPQTRDAADVIVASNDDDGVAQALQQYILDN